MSKNSHYNWIPTQVDPDFFNEFILPYLTKGLRGPDKKLPFITLFNYILYFLHTGCQWEILPIEKDAHGISEVHYITIYRAFRKWQSDGCFEEIFTHSVKTLHERGFLKTDVIHGDGSTTAAKKGAII